MKVIGSNWIDIKDDHPPVNGKPVLVCLESKHLGSFMHVGRWRTDSMGKPLGIISSMFTYDLPPVLYWQELPALPWHQGYPDPAESRDTSNI